MKRTALLSASAVTAAGACALFPAPDSRHFYACTTDTDCTAAGQVCVAGQCGPPGLQDAGPDAGDAGDAGLPDAGDAGDAGALSFQDAGNASLTVALVSGGELVSLTSGMDDGDIYAAGRSIWRLASGPSTSSFVDRGDALAEAVEQGQLDQIGFRPLMYGEVGGDQFAAVSLHDVTGGDDDVDIYVNSAGSKWRQLASFPSLRTWALVDDSNLGPLVYAQVVDDAGAELIEIDEDGGQVALVAPPDAGWACSALTAAPDSGTLYVGLSNQVSLQTTALAIDNFDGGPTVDLELPLGVIPIPNPGGCRHIGPMAWTEFRGEGGFHSRDLLFWDGTSGLGTLESIELFAGAETQPLEPFDGGPPLALTVATDLDFIVASEGNFLFGQSITSGLFTPGPFVNVLPAPVSFLASSTQQVLAETSTGLYDVTTLATIDGGGTPVLADIGLNGQVPFGYASGPQALFAFGGSDHSFPSLLQDTGLGFTPFASPVGEDCGSQTPIADNTTLVVCDGGALYEVKANKVTPMGTAPGPLLAQDAPDGGIWLYSQTTPVQVADLDGGFSVIPGTQAPVWGSPLGGQFEATYALANSGEVVLLNGPKKNPTQLGAAPFTGAGVVDPTIGNSFVGADSQGTVWQCTALSTPAGLSCANLCAAADPVVELQYQVVIPLGQIAGLWILSRAALPAGTDVAVLPPGQSHLAYVGPSDLLLGGRLGAPPPACPLVDLTFPDPAAPEALLGIAAAPSPKPGSIGSFYLQGSRHLLTLSR